MNLKSFLLILLLLASSSAVNAETSITPDSRFLDFGFGTGGKVETRIFAPPGSQCAAGASAVAIQPNGKIVTAGFCNKGTFPSVDADFAVVRYNTDGTLDVRKMGPGPVPIVSGIKKFFFKYLSKPSMVVTEPGFSEDGIEATNFLLDSSNRSEQASAVVIQSDQKIVVGGYSTVAGGAADFALVRYNTDGTLDSTFGNGGRVIDDLGGREEISDIAILPDGKIVAVGFFQDQTTYATNCAVVRYNTDGSRDLRFSTNEIPQCHYAKAVAALPGGDILVAGTGWNSAILARFYSNGNPAESWPSGGHGIAILPVDPGKMRGGSDLIVELAPDSSDVQPTGKILISGYQDNGSYDTDLLLARFDLRTGDLDSTFGSGGVVKTEFETGDASGAAAVVRQSDGKYVVAGWHAYEQEGVPIHGTTFGLLKDNFVLARYNADGTLDTNFGGEGTGRMKSRFNCGRATALDLAIDSIGKIVAVGFCENLDVDPASKAVSVAARYWPEVHQIVDPAPQRSPVFPAWKFFSR